MKDTKGCTPVYILEKSLQVFNHVLNVDSLIDAGYRGLFTTGERCGVFQNLFIFLDNRFDHFVNVFSFYDVLPEDRPIEELP